MRLNWYFILHVVQNATYSSHRAPCPARDFFPWLNKRVKVHISVWTIREYPKSHSSYLSHPGDTFLPLIRLYIAFSLLHADWLPVHISHSKIKVPRDVRNSKSPETRQVPEWIVSILNQIQVPKWTWLGVRSKCPPLVSRTRCKYSLGNFPKFGNNNKTGSKSVIISSFVTRSRFG